MLDTLRSIVQEVNSAPDLDAVLGLIVARVHSSMGTEVCSVYLADSEDGRLRFMATEGLNRAMVGKLSLAPGEGLVGLVALRAEPLNLDDAQHHPRFRYLEEIGEEAYNAFLGVPIIHQRRVLGVLVVQQRLQRRFDASEEAFLVTLSAQLAGIIAHAEATGGMARLGRRRGQRRDARFPGVPGAPGVVHGTAVVLFPSATLEAVPDQKSDDVEQELELFR
ncbi:MAG: GAF domain-containing protein, partial [Pseudomonadales bacterium]